MHQHKPERVSSYIVYTSTRGITGNNNIHLAIANCYSYNHRLQCTDMFACIVPDHCCDISYVDSLTSEYFQIILSSFTDLNYTDQYVKRLNRKGSF